MSKLEFISRLRQCLAELPEEEIERALEYYEDYFDDSPKTEEEVAADLALPEEIAENIKKEILGKTEDKKESPEADDGVFTERGFEMPQDRENYQEVDKFTQMAQTSQPQQEKQQENQQENQQQQYQYRYDEKKEKKKNRNFILMLLIIFGCIWLVILILIVLAAVLFSFRKNSGKTAEEIVKQQVATEITSEIEDAVEDAFDFFEDDDEDAGEEHQKQDADQENKDHDYGENEHDEKGHDENENNEKSASFSGKADFIPDQNIQSLKIDFAVGKIKICEGSQFSARITKNKNNVEITSEVKNGVWKLKQEKEDSIWDNLKKIFGKNAAVSITITVPEGFEAEELKIGIDAGTLKADSLAGKEVDFEVDTGSIKVEKLIASKKASLEVDMGSITISSGNINNLDLECDMGKASYTGILTGSNKIECNMGSVSMNFENTSRDYTFSAENSMGKININGKSYSGLDSEVTTGNGDAKVKLSVDMGTIKIKTKE